MKINSLRASSINTYQDCPWKFFLINILQFPSLPSKKTELGTTVHLVLELLAKANKNGYRKYYESFRTNPEYLLDAVWNHFTKKHPEFQYTGEDKQFCLDQIQAVIKSSLDPLSLKILKTEHQFEIEINEAGFECGDKYLLFRGTIDLITELDEETLHIIDYKTGKRLDWITGEPKSLEDFFKDTQLRLYYLASTVLYKKYKNCLITIFFTSDGGPFTVSFTKDEIPKILESLRQYYVTISQDKFPARILDNRDRVKEFWKCNYVCQFGLYEVNYINENADLVSKFFKANELKKIPDEIDGLVRISDTPKRLCDKYQEEFLEGNARRLYQINVAAASEKSRRNDYNASGISKEKLHDPS